MTRDTVIIFEVFSIQIFFISIVLFRKSHRHNTISCKHDAQFHSQDVQIVTFQLHFHLNHHHQHPMCVVTRKYLSN